MAIRVGDRCALVSDGDCGRHGASANRELTPVRVRARALSTIRSECACVCWRRVYILRACVSGRVSPYCRSRDRGRGSNGSGSGGSSSRTNCVRLCVCKYACARGHRLTTAATAVTVSVTNITRARSRAAGPLANVVRLPAPAQGPARFHSARRRRR